LHATIAESKTLHSRVLRLIVKKFLGKYEIAKAFNKLIANIFVAMKNLLAFRPLRGIRERK
jgi:hypothetical protein